MLPVRIAYLLFIVSAALWSKAAFALPADTVLLNGKIVRDDAPTATAVAVQGNNIAAVGSNDDMQPFIDAHTRVIDLNGRTLIPGLIDSHIHAIRAGLTWQSEVSWIGMRSLAEALDRIRAKAASLPPGRWIVVAGGWTPRQFVEDRMPTRAEIDAVAPAHPVFVQLFYSRLILNRRGDVAMGLSRQQLARRRLRFETDRSGARTGWITGSSPAISALFDRLPRPALDDSIAGTQDFFRELNKVGLTGIVDPGGYNVPPTGYEAVFALWRRQALSIRIRYSLCAPRPMHELEDLDRMTRSVATAPGDDWLRFNGIGETITWRMYNNDRPSPNDLRHLETVLRWAASRGLSATFHWNNDRSVHHLLDVIARIDKDRKLADLRWSIAHLNDASLASLQRMKALAIGWLMQDAFYFRGTDYLRHAGPDAVADVPPIASAIRQQLPVGAGTDAHRVMGFSPFVALQWMLDGKTIDGLAIRSPAELPTRLEALRLYTEGSAWFSFDETQRGSITVGQQADLVVLDEDYWTVPVDRIGSIRSSMTMVDGRIVFASGPFSALERPI